MNMDKDMQHGCGHGHATWTRDMLHGLGQCEITKLRKLVTPRNYEPTELRGHSKHYIESAAKNVAAKF
jgi:hypothetical protein